ncbi:hypothetical protein KVR01_005323 [Diaporthe batatas]|uniref:uncharacterized protein n=1 Tax=Diaporthe batatas TaxID=748121 RepID=UPI001D03D563|nr:uncharacterized protein KVR01_005323 [Diaporthe batatas]KAG8165048.1 hypothetical protein KVR01_005323 [Diaporthe batatas]
MPAGTRILSETPLITVPGAHKDRSLAENVAAVCKEVIRVNIDTHYDLFDFSRRLKCDQQIIEAVENFFKQPMPAHLLSWSVKSFSKIFAFYQGHAVDLPGKDASALFYRYSRINHSCSPNAQAYYDPAKQRHQVQLVRDVKAGDQIFVSYISGTEFPRELRHANILLDGHKFVCDCTLCNSQEAEAVLKRIPDLYRELSDFRNRVYSYGRPQQANSASIPRKEALGALSKVEELLGILRHPSVDVLGPPLSLALQLCIWLQRELGNIRAAAAYARERLALHARLYGFDADDVLTSDFAAGTLRVLENELSRMEAGAPWGLYLVPVGLGED